MKVTGDQSVYAWLHRIRQLLAQESGIDVSLITICVDKWEAGPTEMEVARAKESAEQRLKLISMDVSKQTKQ